MSTSYYCYVGYKDDDGVIYPIGPYDKDGNLRHIDYYSSSGYVIFDNFHKLDKDKMSIELRRDVLHIGGDEEFDEIIYEFENMEKFYPDSFEDHVIMAARRYNEYVEHGGTKLFSQIFKDTGDCIRAANIHNYLEEEDLKSVYDGPWSGYWVSYINVSDLGSVDYVKRGYFLVDDIKQYVEGESAYDLFYDSMTELEYTMRSENEKKFGPPGEKEDCEGFKYTPHSCADYAYFSYPDYNSVQYASFLFKKAASMFDDTRGDYKVKIGDKEYPLVIICHTC